MTTIAGLAATAALIGDPTRAAMLVALMDGRALTAGELASAAGVAPPTASGHLARLLDGGVIAGERQGRHRYYRLAAPAVAATIESLMSAAAAIAPVASKRISTGPRERALRLARTCYNHLAGTVAVRIADSMVAHRYLDRSEDGAALTESGGGFLRGLEVDLQTGGGRAYCRMCLDWSERRHHLAGKVGASLYRAMVERHWARPVPGSRAVVITPAGAAALERHFGVRLDACP